MVHGRSLRLLKSICWVLAISGERNSGERWVARWWIQYVVSVLEAIAGINFACPLIEAANHSFIDRCDQAPLRLPKMQDYQLLTLDWRSFSGWGSEHLTTCLLYKCYQYIRKLQCSTIVNIVQWPVGYLNATINRKTRNAERHIEHDGSS